MLTKQEVVETDTHTIVWRVDDITDANNPVPVDVTGADVSFRVKKGNEATIVLEGSVKDGPAGLIQHDLTGTLTAGEYKVQAVLVLTGDQTTAPTKAKMGVLLVNPAL